MGRTVVVAVVAIRGMGSHTRAGPSLDMQQDAISDLESRIYAVLAGTAVAVAPPRQKMGFEHVSSSRVRGQICTLTAHISDTCLGVSKNACTGAGCFYAWSDRIWGELPIGLPQGHGVRARPPHD